MLKLSNLTWTKLNKKIDLKGLSLKRSEFVSAVVWKKKQSQSENEGTDNIFKDTACDLQILIFGGIDQNFHVCNDMIKIELFKSDY